MSSNQLGINLEENCKSLSINREIYLRILTKAIDQTKQDIHDLEEALPISDFEKLQSISHRLKGDYDNMRLTTLSMIAKEMNEIAKTTHDKEKLTGLLTNFKDYFVKLENFVGENT